MEEEDYSTSHLSYPPVCFNGCNASELLKIILISMVLSFFAAEICIMALFGIGGSQLILGLAVFVVLTLLVAFIWTCILKRAKSDKPEGYFEMRVSIFMQKISLGNEYLTRNGRWSVSSEEIKE